MVKSFEFVMDDGSTHYGSIIEESDLIDGFIMLFEKNKEPCVHLNPKFIRLINS